MSNIIFLWNSKNKRAMSDLSSRFGLDVDDLKYIFKNICNKKYDFIVIDSTRPDKLLRKNLFNVINYKNE